MEPTTMDEYIARREEVLGGEPIIEGPRTPVRAIVDEWRRGTPPEEIPEGMPHRTQAQVFAALRSCLADGYEAETQRATCMNGAQTTPVAALPGKCRSRSAREP